MIDNCAHRASPNLKNTLYIPSSDGDTEGQRVKLFA